MPDSLFIISYIQGCAAGAIRSSECGPVWQLATIASLLVTAVAGLLLMRLRALRR